MHEHSWIYKENNGKEYVYECVCGDRLIYDSWDTLDQKFIRREQVQEK